MDEETRRLADWTLWGEAQRNWVGACLCERSWKIQGPSSSPVPSRDWKKDQETECLCVYVCAPMSEPASVCGTWCLITWSENAQETPSFLDIGRAVEHPLLSPSLFSAPKASSLETKFKSGKEGTCFCFDLASPSVSPLMLPSGPASKMGWVDP